MLSLLASIARVEIARLRLGLRQRATIAALYAFAGLIGLTASGFAIAGIYTAIAQELGAVPALFIMAGGGLVLSIGVAAAAHLRARRVAAVPVRTEPIVASRLASRPALTAVAVASFTEGLARGLVRRR
jgi:hypothetical protein